MVVLPSRFVATRYPGYFWDTDSLKLFSIKRGILKELTSHRGWSRNGCGCRPGYKVSVNGIRRNLTLEGLQKLEFTTEIQFIPEN